MTKLLSDLLEAKEPEFRQTVQRLETASGNANHDIHLSEAIIQLSRVKLKALKLDPDDTTGEELFRALQSKLQQDDAKLVKTLRQISVNKNSAAGNLSQGVAHAVSSLAKDNYGYGVKSIIIKRLMLKSVPKKTMKMLNYRSAASMIKHEPVGLLVIAALKLESNSWISQYRQALSTMTAQECEQRPVTVYCLVSEKWQTFSKLYINQYQQTVAFNKELTSIVIMNLPSIDPTPGLTTATLAIALSSLNAIRSSSSYLQLTQVTRDFGQRLVEVTNTEPKLGVSALESQISWETIQRFFHQLTDKIDHELEAQHELSEIKGWLPIETMMCMIAPELEFWKAAGHLAKHYHPIIISMNILDNALSLCNNRSYTKQYKVHAQRTLWQEFVLRYIKLDLLKAAINLELQPKLAAELA